MKTFKSLILTATFASLAACIARGLGVSDAAACGILAFAAINGSLRLAAK